MADAAPSTSAPTPDRYRHWKLSARERRRLSHHGRERGWRPPARLQAEAQLLRSRRRHRAGRRRAAPALRASRGGARGHPHQRRTASSAPAPTSTCSACRTPRLQGELLQVHQRDAPRHRGRDRALAARRYIAAINGIAAGGGYELALACDEIVLVDDGSSAVSLPEVPLLAVLPGTGGLTRAGRQAQGAPRPRRRLLHHRRGRARQARASTGAWSTTSIPPQQASPRRRSEVAEELAARVDRPRRRARASRCRRSSARSTATRIRYAHRHRRDRPRARAPPTLTRQRPRRARRRPTPPAIHAAGARCWPLRAGPRARRRDPAPARSTSPRSAPGCCTDRGRCRGRARGRRRALLAHAGATGSCARSSALLRRTLKRLDVSSRSLFALVEPGSCFAGTLLELALAADRVLHAGRRVRGRRPARGARGSTAMNFGPYPDGATA